MSLSDSAATRLPERVAELLPRGRTLPAGEWRSRHTSLLLVLAAHLVGLPIFGLVMGWSLAPSLLSVLPAFLLGAVAVAAPLGRTARACCTALALLSCSAALVVLWHGTIEAHFHYFVMTAALALYEEWAVYGLAVGYVVLQHGLMSQIRSDAVFAHPMAMGSHHGMWTWAVVHGGFILAMSVANLVTWRASERARQQAADAYATARHQADHDPLTGLVNRARFGVELRAALSGQRGGEVVGVLFVDLDDFKQVNDTVGHAAGDELLLTIGRRLSDALRPHDVVSRFGGDEFALCVTAAHRDEVERIADRIAFTLRAPVILGSETRSITASIGIAFTESDGARADALLRDADSAMYLAKRQGKGRRRTAPRADRRRIAARGAPDVAPRPRSESSDVATAAELDALLGRGAITSLYQPVVRLDDEEVVGYEALARGPAGSPLATPDVLFATAARTDRVGELDWACRAAALHGARRAALSPAHMLLVNVEPAALGTPCPAHLRATWDGGRSDFDVVVEVTERDLTGRPSELLAAMADVRARGWGIALDDVGADMRSLALMPLLEPDIIKLDLRLVQGQPTKAVAEIVSAVNAEAERTGALVLAEGIETRAHLVTARALGATYGQGWYFGRPAPLPDTEPPVRPLVRRARTAHDGSAAAGSTPYVAVAEHLTTRRGDKRLLLDITRTLEEQAFRLGSSGVVASAFQDASRFTDATLERYALLAHDAALVAALGVGMAKEPAPGVRGAAIPDDDPLRDEWSVAVIGPHFAGALVAVDLGDVGPDPERRFDFALTYDRALVIAAAKTLISRVDPSADAATASVDGLAVPLA